MLNIKFISELNSLIYNVNMKKIFCFIILTFISACSQESAQTVTSEDIAKNADGALPAFFQCLRDNDVTLVSAHRGGPIEGYPENAIETFERTTENASVVVELDVVKSKDDQLFILHDSTLERTTTLSGLVKNTNWLDIKEATLKDNGGNITDFHPPSLSETLNWAKGKALLQIDMKPPLNVNDVVEEVIKSKAEGRVFYIAYSIEDAQKILEKLPNAFVSIGLANQAELERLLDSGIDTHQIHSLTPNVEQNKQFLKTLNSYGITTVGLTFDLAFENTSFAERVNWQEVVNQYQARADSGIEILASNKPVDAFKALSEDPEYRKALLSCLNNL